MLKINLNWDSSVTWSQFDKNNKTIGLAEEATFKNAVQYAAHIYENLFTNNVTVTIDVGWGEMGGPAARMLSAKTDPSATSHGFPEIYKYSDLYQALINHAQSPIQKSAYATLPGSYSFQNGPPAREVVLSQANARALQMPLPIVSTVDGWIGFNSTRPWTFDLHDTPVGTQSLVADAEHEISEVMGRMARVGTIKDTVNGDLLYTPMDLFRYVTSNGVPVRDFTASSKKGSTAYFSIDNGVTDLGLWNNYTKGGDLGDWGPFGPAPGGADAYGGGTSTLGPKPLTMTDLELMNVIGWNTNDLPNIVDEGVMDWVGPGPKHSNFQILSGGVQEVGQAAFAAGTIIYGGGEQKVDGGGFANGAVVSGGTQDIYAGGTASGTDVVSGNQYVSSGGTVVDTFVADAGYEWIRSGGSASGTTLSGGKMIMDGGGTASGTVIEWVGEAFVGGTTRATTISAGFEEVQSGGVAYSTVVSGGALNVDVGGMASGTIVSSGGEYVGGYTSGTVLDGGVLVDHGTSVATTVNSAAATLYDFGADIGTTLSAGREFVESGGVASGTIVSAGMLAVLSGGTANGTALDNGTVQLLQGGVVDGATISGGIMLVIGTTNATTVDGGREIVGAGATANSTVIGDGTLEIGNGGAVGGATPVTFTSGSDGTLRIDASAGFQPHFGPIAGFAGQDKIDLSDIAFGNNTTLGYQGNNTSGILTVGNGVGAAHLLMLGQYTAANFAIASDGHGGTLVTDPPLQQQPQQMLVHPHA